MSSPRPQASSSKAALVGASLAATAIVVLGSLTGSLTGAGAGQVLLTAAALGVLTAVLASTRQQVVRPLPVRVNPSGVAEAVPASTAYWCALDAPSCPQRPRAPGRH